MKCSLTSEGAAIEGWRITGMIAELKIGAAVARNFVTTGAVSS